ncbi:unnamed protein product [Linum trigynum]|uniref:Uncharacterized protein n=1 Tax=Linum trigynum TaxID=586398 RepID=A0AAV2DG11_9ROSI
MRSSPSRSIPHTNSKIRPVGTQGLHRRDGRLGDIYVPPASSPTPHIVVSVDASMPGSQTVILKDHPVSRPPDSPKNYDSSHEQRRLVNDHHQFFEEKWSGRYTEAILVQHIPVSSSPIGLKLPDSQGTNAPWFLYRPSKPDTWEAQEPSSRLKLLWLAGCG